MGNSPASRSQGSGSISHVPSTYDYSKTTEENYSTDKVVYVGKFAEIRATLDYNYHKHYTAERQLLQDKVMLHFDSRSDGESSGAELAAVKRPGREITSGSLQNWLVFTAGAMGAGKTHTLLWLARANLFPLDSFVRVDPDSLRDVLPETREYRGRDVASAAMMTQKEVGYMAEILTMYALQEFKNVLVDGSLRNAEWYQKYISSIRADYPGVKLAILHVLAPESTVFARCRAREAVTGRHVPEEVVRESMNQLPVSIQKLAPFVDTVITFENDNVKPGVAEGPVLISSPATELCDGELPASLTNSPLTFTEFTALFKQRTDNRRQTLGPNQRDRTNSMSAFGPLREERYSEVRHLSAAAKVSSHYW